MPFKSKFVFLNYTPDDASEGPWVDCFPDLVTVLSIAFLRAVLRQM